MRRKSLAERADLQDGRLELHMNHRDRVGGFYPATGVGPPVLELAVCGRFKPVSPCISDRVERDRVRLYDVHSPGPLAVRHHTATIRSLTQARYHTLHCNTRHISRARLWNAHFSLTSFSVWGARRHALLSAHTLTQVRLLRGARGAVKASPRVSLSEGGPDAPADTPD